MMRTAVFSCGPWTPYFTTVGAMTEAEDAAIDLVESLRTRHGPYQLRLVFSTSPPAGFLDAATDRTGDER